MVISKYPSVVTMPEADKPYPSMLDFLFRTFPNVPRQRWVDRLAAGRVLDEQGNPVTAGTTYSPSKRIFYFRETEAEPVVPFAEQILFQDDQILVACKPHFLPVIPGGRYVEECLLNRLRTRTGIADLAPMHRIDRETAGLVLFSVNRKTRGLYHDLFMHGKVEKTYHAVAQVHRPPEKDHWLVENRIERGEPRFRMQVVAGIANSCSHIQLLKMNGSRGHFRLRPVTGKTHQLRLHMSGLGFGIVHDPYYPELLPKREDNFDQPLQLLARKIEFNDPVTGKALVFRSERALLG